MPIQQQHTDADFGDSTASNHGRSALIDTLGQWAGVIPVKIIYVHMYVFTDLFITAAATCHIFIETPLSHHNYSRVQLTN